MPDQMTLELDRLRRRHRDFYLELAEQAHEHILWHGFWADSDHQREWLSVLDAEQENLRTAIRWSLDAGEREMVLRFGVALGGSWSHHRRHAEGRRILAEALDGADDGPLSDALAVAGLLAMEDGDLADARRLLDRALDTARSAGDDRRVVRAMIELAWLANAAEGITEFAERAQAALDAAKSLDDSALISRALEARVWSLRSDDEAALEDHERELRNLSADVPRRIWLDELNTIADCWGVRGDLERYERIHREETLPLARELGDPQFMAYMLANLAYVYLRRGETDRAAPLLEEAIAAARAAEIPGTIAAILEELARLGIAEGRYATAEILAGEGLQTLRDLPAMTSGDRRTADGLSLILVQAQTARGDVRAARALLDARIEQLEGAGDDGAVQRALEARIQLASLTGDTETATADCRRIMSLPGEASGQGHNADRIEAWLATHEERFSDALRAQTTALERLANDGQEMMAEVPYLIDRADLRAATGDLDGAIDDLRRALGSAERREQLGYATHARVRLAVMYLRLGRPRDARPGLQQVFEQDRPWGVDGTAVRVEAVAALAAQSADEPVAARLLAATSVVRERTGIVVPVVDRGWWEALVEQLRGFEDAWAEGMELSLADAREMAARYVDA